MAEASAARPDLSDDERAILRLACWDRVRHLRAAAARCAGNLYRGLYLDEAERLRVLYQRLAGEELGHDA